MHRKYTKEEFIEAVKKSYSKAQCLKTLGVIAAGGNYRIFDKYIKLYDVDCSHFTGQCWNKGKKFAPKRPIEDYLSNKQYIYSYSLKKRLLSDGILPHQCQNCQLKEWKNNPIPLELHHIDGNHENNNLDNIQLLCPNCHSLTDNYRGKVLKKEAQSIHIKEKTKIDKQKSIKYYNTCIDCKKKCSITATRCKSCAVSLRQKDTCKRPSKEQLLQDVEDLKYLVHVGKKYNVSDTAVRKWFTYYNLSIPNNYHKS